MKVCFIDTETGGLERKHPTIQIGAVAVENGAEVEAFEVKLRFKAEDADPEALAGNCYDAEIWEHEAVGVKEGYKGFLDFLGRHRTVRKTSRNGNTTYTVARLGGYNIANFDYPRLRGYIGMLAEHDNTYRSVPADPYLLDVYQLACWLHAIRPLPVPDLKMQTLAAHYGIEVKEAHDALDDARTAAAVGRKVLAALLKGATDG